MTTPKIIILLGSSGSGKGTQAKLLQQKFGLDYVGSGDLLRARGKIDDFTGKKLFDVVNQGKFAPTAIIFKLWIDKLEELKRISDFKGFIIDGSPRKLFEAELIDQALEWYDWGAFLRVLLVSISEEEVFLRLSKRRICKACGRAIPFIGDFKKLEICDSCGGELVARADDTREGIMSRIALFKKEVMPVIEYYKKSDRLTSINGEQSIEDVHKDIMKAITQGREASNTEM